MGSPKENVLVVKFGALGDVVRTSYFAEAIKRDRKHDVRITWLTAPTAADILRFNPYVDRVATSFHEVESDRFDVVYSLDDEDEIVAKATRVSAGAQRHGAFFEGGKLQYTESSSGWFDMGLRSRHGKAEADRLKKANIRTHGEIFSEIFGVRAPIIRFFHSEWALERWAAHWARNDEARIGLSIFAGARWPAKSLRQPEVVRLVTALAQRPFAGRQARICLFGSGGEAEANRAVVAALSERARSSVECVDSSASVLEYSAAVAAMDAYVTADTLGMHLAIANRLPTVAFFTVTSAEEIDTNGVLAKVRDSGPDYCTYRPRGDNSGITADRLLDALRTCESLVSQRHRPA